MACGDLYSEKDATGRIENARCSGRKSQREEKV
jgi:hypothetical protein